MGPRVLASVPAESMGAAIGYLFMTRWRDLSISAKGLGPLQESDPRSDLACPGQASRGTSMTREMPAGLAACIKLRVRVYGLDPNPNIKRFSILGGEKAAVSWWPAADLPPYADFSRKRGYAGSSAEDAEPSYSHQFLMILPPNIPLGHVRGSIVQHFAKLYPEERPITVDRLRDEQDCDLDDDFFLGQVVSDKGMLIAVCQHAAAAEGTALHAPLPCGSSRPLLTPLSHFGEASPSDVSPVLDERPLQPDEKRLKSSSDKQDKRSRKRSPTIPRDDPENSVDLAIIEEEDSPPKSKGKSKRRAREKASKDAHEKATEALSREQVEPMIADPRGERSEPSTSSKVEDAAQKVTIESSILPSQSSGKKTGSCIESAPARAKCSDSSSAQRTARSRKNRVMKASPTSIEPASDFQPHSKGAAQCSKHPGTTLEAEGLESRSDKDSHHPCHTHAPSDAGTSAVGHEPHAQSKITPRLDPPLDTTPVDEVPATGPVPHMRPIAESPPAEMLASAHPHLPEPATPRPILSGIASIIQDSCTDSEDSSEDEGSTVIPVVRSESVCSTLSQMAEEQKRVAGDEATDTVTVTSMSMEPDSLSKPRLSLTELTREFKKVSTTVPQAIKTKALESMSAAKSTHPDRRAPPKFPRKPGPPKQ